MLVKNQGDNIANIAMFISYDLEFLYGYVKLSERI